MTLPFSFPFFENRLLRKRHFCSFVYLSQFNTQYNAMHYILHNFCFSNFVNFIKNDEIRNFRNGHLKVY